LVSLNSRLESTKVAEEDQHLADAEPAARRAPRGWLERGQCAEVQGFRVRGSNLNCRDQHLADCEPAARRQLLGDGALPRPGDPHLKTAGSVNTGIQ